MARTRSKRQELQEEDPDDLRRKKHMTQSYNRVQQEEAFKELLKLLGANGGKLPYGAMENLVKTYNKNGFTAVNHDNLNYRLKRYRNNPPAKDNPVIGKKVTTSNDTLGVVSDLTAEETSNHLQTSEAQISTTATITTDSNTSSGHAKKTNIGGHAKGSTKAAAAAMKEKLNHLVTHCAALYHKKKEEAKLSGVRLLSGVEL
jgi:hypothetical protein